MQKVTLKVDSENNHLRLDIFISKKLENCPSRTFVKRLIEEGKVSVNQKHVKAHYQVSEGDEITVDIEENPVPDKNIAPEDIELDIFYEDPFLLIINKPAGMLVHPVKGILKGTLVNALLYYSRSLSSINSEKRPGIVHRLDRDTSGLVVIAKDDKTHVFLARQFEKRKVRKRYVALVSGKIEFEEGIIDAPIGRHPVHFDKKTVSFLEDSREARTYYRVVRRFPSQTLVALYPQSGRTHQLRVHMTHLGYPILGDEKYGMKNSFPRLALHAQALGFLHPASRSFVEYFSPTPKEFLNLNNFP